MKNDKVTIINAWHDDNAGDSAIADVCITVAKSRWPNARIDVHTMLGPKDRKFSDWNRHLKVNHPTVNYRPSLFPEPETRGHWRILKLALRSIASAPLLVRRLPTWGRFAANRRISQSDRLVVIGGSDLFQLRSPRVTSALRLRRLLEPCLIASKQGIPYSIWGHTLGPFETDDGRKLMGRVLSQAEEVVVRENISAKLAHELAPDCQVRVLPDLAFALPADTSLGAAHRYAVFVPRGHILDSNARGNERLVAEFSRLALSLVRANVVEEVLVVPQVVGPNKIEDDTRIVKQIVAKCDDPRVRVSGQGASPRQLRALYADAEAVVAVRLHGAIFALAGGTPAFAVSYFTSKTQGVLEGADMNSSWCTFEEFSAQRVLDWWQTSVNDGQRSVIERKSREYVKTLESLMPSQPPATR